MNDAGGMAYSGAAEVRLRWGTMTGAPLFTLNKEHVGFIESGVSIVTASRDTQNRPLLGHASGCRAGPDGRQITIFLSRAKYPLLLDAVRRSGAIAVSFNEPSTNKSIQIKGADAELVTIESGDIERTAAYLDLFAAELERINFRGELGRVVLACTPADLVAVTFSPIVAFTQTPGPLAGSRIDT